jgi:hypothetical protein
MDLQHKDSELGYNDSDMCPICRQLLYRPTRATACGHAACHACLVAWVATSSAEPQPLDATFRISTSPEPEINGISIGCPVCRTETTTALDEPWSSQLESMYPALHSERATGYTDTEKLMVIQVGNTHKNVPPSISPFSGIPRTHYWSFFLKTSHPDLIESVDLVLHESFRNHRLVTLRKPPFTKSSLGWGYFRIGAFITLRQGWEWASPDAVRSSSKGMGPNDRLEVGWQLDFGGIGKQSLAVETIRRCRSDAGDETLASLCHLFAID